MAKKPLTRKPDRSGGSDSKVGHRTGTNHAPAAARNAKGPVRPPAASKATTNAMESEIQRIDRELVKLLNRRAAATTKLIEARPNPQDSLFDPHADDTLYRWLEEVNADGPLSPASIRSVFREI